MVTMMQWCGIEENKTKITNNLRDKHESIKRNKMEGTKKDKKRKSLRELMEERNMTHHLEKSELQDECCKEPLEILPTQDKTKK